VQRWLLLAIALLMMGLPGLAIGLGSDQPLWPVLLRAGIALFLVWLAIPELRRLKLSRSWPVIAGLGVALLVLVARPKLAPFALAALFAAWLANWLGRRVIRALTRPRRSGK
jgi:multidrug transporter EmrE-like cation transporter